MPSATWIADTSMKLSYGQILHFDQDDADWVFGIDYLTDEVNSDTNFDDSILEKSSLAYLFPPSSCGILELDRKLPDRKDGEFRSVSETVLNR